nr:hypothetical protein FOF69_07510 [Lactobacillus jensenii]
MEEKMNHNFDSLSKEIKKLEFGKDIIKKALSDVEVKDVNRLEFELGDEVTTYSILESNGNETTVIISTENCSDLGRKSREYLAGLDAEIIDNGGIPMDLKKTYIIFLSKNDPFNQGRSKYVFRPRSDEDKSIVLPWGPVIVVMTYDKLKKN